MRRPRPRVVRPTTVGGSDVSSSTSSMNSSGDRSDASRTEDAGVNTLNGCPSAVSAAANWWKTGTAR